MLKRILTHNTEMKSQLWPTSHTHTHTDLREKKKKAC